MMAKAPRRWNALERFLLYGVCGFGCEIMFTAVWEAVENGNRKLHGLTSIYAFVIYGLSALIQEHMYMALKATVSMWLRGVIYVTWSYAWEFSTGLFLRQFDACPWDYASYFSGHFMGLITAEYIPVWYFASLVGECVLFRNAEHLWWGPSISDDQPAVLLDPPKNGTVPTDTKKRC